MAMIPSVIKFSYMAIGKSSDFSAPGWFFETI